MNKLLQHIENNVTIKKSVNYVADKVVEGMHYDSRQILNNWLFFAIKGTQTDGHNFISQAIANGATVVVCQDLPNDIYSTVTYLVVDDSSLAQGIMAANFYDNPTKKLKLIGITGTNGKTTIATLLHNLFTQLGYKVGLLSTIRNYIHTTELKSTHTTPDAIQINKLLSDMVYHGCDYCFMEVSSHAIKQKRIAALKFAGGVFTNITHDHLDYHPTFDDYLYTKKAFFDQLNKDAFALSNIDDKNGEVILQNTGAKKVFYGLKTICDFKGKILENSISGLHLSINQTDVYTRLIGQFNAYNLLAVYGVAIMLNQDKDEVLIKLSNAIPVEGRFEYIKSKNNIYAIVDYAHTPDALDNILNTILQIKQGTEKIIAVVGCGGDRDKAKRPVMARLAVHYADKVVLTSDNPRSENPENIIADMKKGIETKHLAKTLSVVNRKEAIHTAVSLAEAGDIILVAGKGHETYQEVNGVKHHFDDLEIIKETFKIFEV